MNGRSGLAGVAIIGLLAGCGGSSAHRAALTGPSIQTANCHLWRALARPQRHDLLRQMSAFFGGPVDSSSPSGQRGPVLSEARATRVLDASCRAPFADSFTLYKLYGRAAAFAGS